MIAIKRVYDAPAGEDGVRVLVDRLWPRGVSKERAAIAAWPREATPDPERSNASVLRDWLSARR